MGTFSAMVGLSIFLGFTSVSVFAEQTETNSQQHNQSNSPAVGGSHDMGSAIDSKSPSGHNTEPTESEEQKAARPGGVGEEGETCMFGSPSTVPPSGRSSGYTGADKDAEKMKQHQQGM